MPTYTIKVLPKINDLFKSLGGHLGYNGRFSIAEKLNAIISLSVNHCIKSNVEVISAGENFIALESSQLIELALSSI